MKYILLLISFIIFSANNKPLLIKSAENINGELRYSIYINGDDEIKLKLKDIFQKNKFSIDFDEKKSVTTDLLFDLNSSTFSNLDDEKKIEEIVSTIKNKFYTGKKPSYSTIFKNKTEGYDVYRIPSIIKTSNNILIAFSEARGIGKTDCAENDIVAKTSNDFGKTWSSLIIVAQAGEASLNNPTPIFIPEKNKTICMFQYYPPKSFEASTSVGVEGDGVCRTFIVESTNDGKTWSNKIDITKQVKKPNMSAVACGPGIGIRVANSSRIIFPMASTGHEAGWFNYLAYSDDFGKTWKMSDSESWYGTNESQVVQIDEKNFVVNARSHRYYNTEKKKPSAWSPWSFAKVTRFRAESSVTLDNDKYIFTNTKIREDLPDPLCQGFIYRFSGLGDGEKSIILFSNPASNFSLPIKGRTINNTPPARVNGSVRISYDDGKTFSEAKRIYGSRLTGFQYSVLVKVDSKTVGAIFECYPEIKFTSFGLDWLEK